MLLILNHINLGFYIFTEVMRFLNHTLMAWRDLKVPWSTGPKMKIKTATWSVRKKSNFMMVKNSLMAGISSSIICHRLIVFFLRKLTIYKYNTYIYYILRSRIENLSSHIVVPFKLSDLFVACHQSSNRLYSS